MKKVIFALSLMSLLSLSSLAFAMNHGSSHDSHGSAPAKAEMPKDGKMDMHKKDGHMGMEMSKDMVMLGAATVDGIKAMAHISDVREEMAKAGMKATHHFMVAFEDEAKGGMIEQGRVAVRITSPDGKTASAVSMMGMDGHFGADVELTAPGTYTFLVGTKLADDKARQYSFSYELK